MNCPKCGLDNMYDNRQTKRNPKAPDFKCSDRSCDGVIWPPRNAGNSRSQQGGNQRPPQEYPHAKLYKLCVQYTLQEIRPLFKDRELLPEHVLAAAATLFIQASKGGDVFVKKAAPVVESPAPPPPPPQRPPVRGNAMDADDYAPTTRDYADETELPF